jgi:hypothetical protein
MQSAGAAYTTLSTESRRMAADPMLYMDSNWRVRMAAALASLKLSGQQLQSLAAPADAKQLGDLIVSIGYDFIQESDETAAALDSLDSAQLQRALARVQANNQRILQATDELDALKKKFGI